MNGEQYLGGILVNLVEHNLYLGVRIAGEPCPQLFSRVGVRFVGGKEDALLDDYVLASVLAYSEVECR